MPNIDHSRILRQGFRQWNEWRTANPNIVADLSDVSVFTEKLSGANFSGAKLSNVYPAGSYLDNVDFSGADLRGANLSGAVLDMIMRALPGQT